MSKDLALLMEAVGHGAEIAREMFERGAETWEKTPGDPVTEADLAVDAALRDHLTAARPDYGWLSEESVDDPARLDRRRAFIVDPIDGTRAFVKRKPEFVVSAGLVEDGAAVAGAIMNPMTDQAWQGDTETPANMNGVPITPSGQRDIARARILTSAMDYHRGGWTELIPECVTAHVHSIALKIVLVADGRYDALVNVRPTNDWDIAAAVAIAEAAGCIATDARGEPLAFNRPDTRQATSVISTPELHGFLIERLAPVADGLPR